jgi:hypothetical protein
VGRVGVLEGGEGGIVQGWIGCREEMGVGVIVGRHVASPEGDVQLEDNKASSSSPHYC